MKFTNCYNYVMQGKYLLISRYLDQLDREATYQYSTILVRSAIGISAVYYEVSSYLA